MSYDAAKTILLVEDEALIALAEKRTLEDHGYRVALASSGEDAVGAAGAMPEIDLVLMDIKLGRGIDGTVAAARILELRDVPLVFLSSHTERAIAEKTEDIASYGYIVKNSGDAVLLASIKTALRLFESKARERAKTAAPPAGGDTYRAEGAFRESDRDLMTMFDAIDESVCFLERDGTILAANKTFAARLGMTPPACVGTCAFELLSAELATSRRAYMARVLETGEPVCFDDERRGRWIHQHLYPVKDETGRTVRIVIYATDDTERRRALETLRIREALYRTLFEVAPMGLTISDDRGNILESNGRAENLLGLAGAEQAKRRIDGGEWRLFRKDGSPMPPEEFASTRALGEGRLVEKVQMGLARPDGGMTWLNVAAAPVPIDGYGVVIAYNDITERVTAENRIEALLREKDLILKEAHHRIKNNMATVSGLLRLQAETSADAECRRFLEDAASRVQSMMLLYDKLYHSGGAMDLNVRSFLPPLVEQITGVFRGTADVRTEVTSDDFVMSACALSALGIIINELITNSMKHAFAGRTGGRIGVAATKAGSLATIVYEDDGPGLPEGAGFGNAAGFGMQLVGMLAQQAGGSIRIERGAGARFVLELSV